MSLQINEAERSPMHRLDDSSSLESKENNGSNSWTSSDDQEEGDYVEQTEYAEASAPEDSVRLYLSEMGSVPLLTKQGEVKLAKRMERGE